MASIPNYDLNSPFTPTSFYADNWDNLSQSDKTSRIYQMWKVRSVSETYEPGSVFKMATAIAGLETKAISKTEKINDTGIYKRYTDYQPRCWIYNQSHHGHGYVNVQQAIQKSCNYFFFEMGYRLGKVNGKYDSTIYLDN